MRLTGFPLLVAALEDLAILVDQEVVMNEVFRWSLVLAILLAATSGMALAHRGHVWRGPVGVGVVIDPYWHHPRHYPRVYPRYYPHPYYYPPYYYPPTVVTVPSQPPVYIERDEGTAPAPAYWYYCANPRGYYPYVKECLEQWQPVAPRPPDLPAGEK
jgi:hypothetical protein